MEQTKYDVFISYSRNDYVDKQKNVIPGNEVSKIKEALSEAGITFWMDEKGVISGQDYASKITKHIKACKILVYLSSKAANQSDWIRREIACAETYKKYLIPLLLDDSPFNDSVELRIADLDKIDYYINPKLGLEKLVRSIKVHLEELAAEEQRRKREEERERELERKKAEELKLQQELETKRHKIEQQKIVADIKLRCSALNNEETKIELDRANLLLSTEKVTDEDERNILKLLITNSSPIQKKAQADNAALQKANENFKTQIRILTEDRDKATESINNKMSEMKELINREKTLQHEIERLNDELQKTRENLHKLESDSDKMSEAALAKSNKRLKVGIAIFMLATLIMSTIALRQCWGSETSAETIAKIAENNSAALISHENIATESQSENVQLTPTATPEVTDERVLRAVDLGLSVKWANINVGTSSSCEIGSYFAWGEVSTKLDYKKETYNYFKDGKYELIGEIGEGDNGYQYYNIGSTEYDAAHRNMGGKWRMPTESECLELKNKCTWAWNSAKSGYVVTGKNGNHIFLPATGCMSDKHIAFLHSKAKKGYYWSSKTANTSQYSYGGSASVLQFDPNSSAGIVVSPIDRIFGRCIRAVCE